MRVNLPEIVRMEDSQFATPTGTVKEGTLLNDTRNLNMMNESELIREELKYESEERKKAKQNELILV